MSKDTKNEHHLILEKFTPESLVALRTELAKPENKDIFDRANRESTFEGCLATIGECLDIALDGYYDVPDLCDVLVTAMRARSLHGNQPHLRDKRLVNAELVERAGEVSLEKVSSEVPGVIVPNSTSAEWEKFLTEEEGDCTAGVPTSEDPGLFKCQQCAKISDCFLYSEIELRGCEDFEAPAINLIDPTGEITSAPIYKTPDPDESWTLFTAKEGEEWQELLDALPVGSYHSLRTADGREWDVVNGWRETGPSCSNCCYKEYEILNATMLCINTPNGFALGPDKVCNKWEHEKKQEEYQVCPMCGAGVQETPSGTCCDEGHGGITPIPLSEWQAKVPCECGRGEVCDEKCR